MTVSNEKLLEPYNPFLIKWNFFLFIRSIILIIFRLPLVLLSIIFTFLYFFIPFPRMTCIDMLVGKLFCFSFGIKVKVKNLKENKAYYPKIIMSNHTSIFDHFIIPSITNVKYGAVLGQTAKKSFLFGWTTKKFGSLIIEKGQSTVKKIEKYLEKEDYRNNGRLIIYPEGRHTNGKFMTTFRTGGFLYNEDIQPLLITSDSFFLDENEIKKGKFGIGMKHFKKPDYKYLLLFLFRLMINTKINITVLLLPVFKKEEYCQTPKETAEKLRNIMLKYDQRIQKMDTDKLTEKFD